jgi:hypoxanthine phosphoribosyltransferase
MPPRLGRVLISGEEIAARVAELGRAIGREHAGHNPLLVAVLKGAVIFLADLVRAIPLPVSVDFMGVASYGGGVRSSGAVRITADLSESIEGRDVIIVEDIIDTGRTLAYLRSNLVTRRPRTVSVCVLLDKVGRREVDVKLDYVGFVIPDQWVLGYGFDLGGLYRGLPYITVVEAEPSG